MHDINGKPLHIGSSIYSYAHGMLIIKDIKEEHNPDKEGALIECIGVAPVSYTHLTLPTICSV